MRVLVSAANGKTGRHVIAALQAHPTPPSIRAFARSPIADGEGVEPFQGDLDDPSSRRAAMEGIDAVIHYGPPLDPREISMGTGMIDAAKAAGVRRFVFVSVLHPEIDDLVNHQAKLAIENHLISSGMDWTVLRPQHYMQNIDVRRAVSEGFIAMPYPPETVLGHVDMVDLAEAAAKVTLEAGHSYATYDIAANEHLSVIDICREIARQAGRPVEARSITPGFLIEMIERHRPLTTYSIEAFHRLFGYYARNGIYGNANVLGWLLGRPPRSFADYVRRSLP